MPGVREAGMGNTGVASAIGAQAMSWNPAASAGVRGFAASASYVKWLLDTRQQSLSLVRGFGFASLGVGLSVFEGGAFEHRAEVPIEEPLGEFMPYDFNFRLNVSRSFGPVVQAGLSGRYYYSKIMESTAHGPGLEAGVRVGPVEGLTVGASVVDFGKNLVYYRESFRLPTRARLGMGYGLCLGSARFDLGLDGSYFVYTGAVNVHSGVEFRWDELVALRAGHEWLDGQSRFGFGLGLMLSQFRFDYSFTPLNDDLGTAHRVSVGLSGRG